MSNAWLADKLEVLSHRIATEIENVHARTGGNGDARSFGLQLESLKYNVMFEIELLKVELRAGNNKDAATNQDAGEEIKRLQEELTKSKQLIKLHQLAESITQRLDEKSNVK